MQEFPDPAAVELSPNPFGGLGIYSTSEDLALAEIQHQLSGVDIEADGVERRVLTYQLEAVSLFLGENYPGYELPPELDLKSRLFGERMDLLKTPNIHQVDLDPLSIIRQRAANARWRMVEFDSSTISERDREWMQEKWSEAADKAREAELAQLAMELAKLIADHHLSEILTGQGIDGYEARSGELYGQMQKLERNRSSGTGGWGGGGGGGRS